MKTENFSRELGELFKGKKFLPLATSQFSKPFRHIQGSS